MWLAIAVSGYLLIQRDHVLLARIVECSVLGLSSLALLLSYRGLPWANLCAGAAYAVLTAFWILSCANNGPNIIRIVLLIVSAWCAFDLLKNPKRSA